MNNISEKQKDIIRLATSVEFGDTGDTELLLLKKLHKTEDDVVEVKKELEKKVDKTELEKELARVKTTKGDKGDSIVGPMGPAGKDGKTPQVGVDYIIPKDGKDGYTPVKGKDYFDGKDGTSIVGPQGPTGQDGKDGSPDMAEDVRNKLELLTGDERLKASAIQGMEELISEVKALKNSVQTPAKAYMIYLKDCSSQCNGTTKIFSVGGTHRGIVGIYSTEFPINFRPIIDYTETSTGFTLTAQVSAPQSGQTLVAQFLK